jgi:vacuolar-type H+-ATPase subunit C/Vma6
VGRVPDYNFLCGILQSREQGFVASARLDAVLSARSVEEAASQLPDGPFAAEVRKAPSFAGIEGGARAEIGALRDLLAKYSPSGDLEGLLLEPLDWFNLKVAVLQKLSGRRDDRLPGPEGTLRFADLSAMAESGKYEGLPKALADGLGAALAAYVDAGRSTQAFELALDRRRELSRIAHARAISRSLGAHALESADLAAAVALARAVLAGIAWKIARHAFSGLADEARFSEIAAAEPAEWSARLGGIGSTVIREVLAAVAAGADVADVAAARRRTLAARIRDWRLRPPSAEYAYWWIARKLADLANLRLALVARLNGLPEAEARKRIDDGLL